MELSPCHLLVQQAIYLGYSKWVWCKKLVSCGRAHIVLENQWNPINLYTVMPIIQIITISSIITIIHIKDNNDNNDNNYHYQDRHILPVSTWVHSQMFGPGVGLCCGRKKEQKQCIPDWIWRDHKGSVVNAWRTNYNEVQSVAAVKWFRRERVAVN